MEHYENISIKEDTRKKIKEDEWCLNPNSSPVHRPVLHLSSLQYFNLYSLRKWTTLYSCRPFLRQPLPIHIFVQQLLRNNMQPFSLHRSSSVTNEELQVKLSRLYSSSLTPRATKTMTRKPLRQFFIQLHYACGTNIEPALVTEVVASSEYCVVKKRNAKIESPQQVVYFRCGELWLRQS